MPLLEVMVLGETFPHHTVTNHSKSAASVKPPGLRHLILRIALYERHQAFNGAAGNQWPAPNLCSHCLQGRYCFFYPQTYFGYYETSNPRNC